MILVYSTFINPRIAYTFESIFKSILGYSVRITLNKNDFNIYKGPRLNYSDVEIADTIRFIPYGLLEEKGIKKQNTECFNWEGLKVFFRVDKKSQWPFDPFSMIFFLLSRYEEYYEDIQTDKHDRYIATQSLAFKNDFLEIPVIDHLIQKLKSLLLSKYSKIEFSEIRYLYQPSFDIDKLYSYSALSLSRSFGGLIRDLFTFKLKKFSLRIKVWGGKSKDPYDNFEKLLKCCKENDLNPICFINLGKHSKYDKNNRIRSKKFIQGLGKIAKTINCGIHPSYYTNDYPSKLEKELNIFKSLFGIIPSFSRQHYIKISLPKTYRMLNHFKIKHDYSMGYSDQIGFRASTSYSFFFYDLKKESKTPLMIHPFVCMDGTLFDSLKLQPKAALDRILKINEHLKKVEGRFIFIWHHSYIADKNKMEFFEKVANLLST